MTERVVVRLGHFQLRHGRQVIAEQRRVEGDVQGVIDGIAAGNAEASFHDRRKGVWRCPASPPRIGGELQGVDERYLTVAWCIGRTVNLQSCYWSDRCSSCRFWRWWAYLAADRLNSASGDVFLMVQAAQGLQLVLDGEYLGQVTDAFQLLAGAGGGVVGISQLFFLHAFHGYKRSRRITRRPQLQPWSHMVKSPGFCCAGS